MFEGLFFKSTMKLSLLVSFLFMLPPHTFIMAEEQDTAATEEPQAGEEGLLKLDFSSEKTVIEANKLLLFAKKRTFTYLGGVAVEHGDMDLTCEKLDGSYNENNEIQTLVAREKVYIEKGDSIKASGNKAVFDAKTQTLRLSENPQLEQEGSLLSADEVLIYLQEDRSEAIGNVRVTVLDKKKSAKATSTATPTASN